MSNVGLMLLMLVPEARHVELEMLAVHSNERSKYRQPLYLQSGSLTRQCRFPHE